ncbi:sulfatase family protein [Horticoccus sp. 23ND18S-11]|uniref:sulfatase family protein n=1 Tax=Horticoccus sp. 23ND18S-11 TaxID=3391832 RepID=UPI0039C993D6
MNSRILLPLLALLLVTVARGADSARPNILFLLADNWLYDHAGANGDKLVKTPVFDRMAREGMRFTNAFCPVPSCGPTRSSLVTGRAPHQLEEIANHGGRFPGKFRVFVDALSTAGYHAGYMGKGWAPGIYQGFGRTVSPAGDLYKDFPAFLEKREPGQPFFFWYGSTHTALRFWKPGLGRSRGIDPAKVRVPGYLPDAPAVREEIADYLACVEMMDAEFGAAIALLEKNGELANTIVIHTSDNGWQMPRGLGSVHDAGLHVPLAVRWPGRIAAGRVVEDFVSVTDYAPTILELAGLRPWPEMTARSFVDLLLGKPAGVVRDHVFVERERHANVRRGDQSYPVRGVRSRDFLYLRNLRPNRWPGGDPIVYLAVGDYGDVDPSRTKQYILDHRTEPGMQPYFALSFKKRPAEELYDLRRDPEQLKNIAADPAYAEALRQQRARVDGWMKATADPRLDPTFDDFDKYPYFGGGVAPELRAWEAEKP